MNIGKIIAGDLLINNSDWFPLVWDNDGNNSNILFEVKTNEKIDDDLIENPNYLDFNYNDAVAIDTVACCINELDRIGMKNMEWYLDRVKYFINSVFEDLKIIISGKFAVNEYDYPSMKWFSAFFHTYTGYDIRGWSLFRIIEGMVIGLFNIQNMGLGPIQDLMDHASTAVTKDWKNVWKLGAATLWIEFF